MVEPKFNVGNIVTHVISGESAMITSVKVSRKGYTGEYKITTGFENHLWFSFRTGNVAFKLKAEVPQGLSRCKHCMKVMKLVIEPAKPSAQPGTPYRQG